MKKDQRRKTCITKHWQREICSSHNATNTDPNILHATCYQLAFWRSVVSASSGSSCARSLSWRWRHMLVRNDGNCLPGDTA